MQINIENVTYNKLKNINTKIEDNKITGIIGRLGSGKTDLTLLISGYIKGEKGTINYNKDIQSSDIGIISNFSYDDMLYGTVKEFIKRDSIKYNYKLSDIDNRVDEILKMVGLSNDILNKSVFSISTSEKTRVILSQILLYNPELIILDSAFEELDSKSRTKLFKLLIKLKKFYNKTIIITSSNIDAIYELCDNLILLDNNNIVFYGDKYSAFNIEEVLNNPFIIKPTVIEVKEKIKEKLGKDLGNNDSINELIKAIYREVR